MSLCTLLKAHTYIFIHYFFSIYASFRFDLKLYFLGRCEVVKRDPTAGTDGLKGTVEK